MISVLNVISDTNIGGAGRVLLNYLRYADRSQFQLPVAIPRGSLLEEPLRELEVPVHLVEGMADRSFDWRDVVQLKRLIAQVNPDLIHTHGALSGRIAGRLQGKRVLYTRHSAFPVKPYLSRGPGRWLNGRLNELLAQEIIAISPAAAQNLTDGGIRPHRITVMMNGVAPVTPWDAQRCQTLREEYQIGEEDFVAGILARIEDYKGHLHILEGVQELKGQGLPCKVLIAGTGSFEGVVRERVAQLGLQDSIRFLGFQKDVAPVLSLLDVQLNASYGTETSSLSILEGMSMGVPAIVSSYGGNPWLVKDGVSGLIFPTGDSHGLAQCMARLMREPETLKRLGQGAKEEYQHRFTGEIFAEQVEQVYRKAMERGSL